jgi:hypothetical protein
LYLEISIGNYRAISYIHEQGEVSSIEYTESTVNLRFRIHEKYVPKLSHLLGYEPTRTSTV